MFGVYPFCQTTVYRVTRSLGPIYRLHKPNLFIPTYDNNSRPNDLIKTRYCKGRVNVFYGILVMKHERMPVNKFIQEKKFIGIKYASSWENCTQSQSDFCYTV